MAPAHHRCGLSAEQRLGEFRPGGATGRAAFSGISNLRRRPRSCAVRTSRPTSSKCPTTAAPSSCPNCLPPCVRNWLSSGWGGTTRSGILLCKLSQRGSRSVPRCSQPPRAGTSRSPATGRSWSGRGAGSAGKMKTAEVSPRPARSGPARAHGPSGRRRAVRLRATRP